MALNWKREMMLDAILEKTIVDLTAEGKTPLEIAVYLSPIARDNQALALATEVRCVLERHRTHGQPEWQPGEEGEQC